MDFWRMAPVPANAEQFVINKKVLHSSFPDICCDVWPDQPEASSSAVRPWESDLGDPSQPGPPPTALAGRRIALNGRTNVCQTHFHRAEKASTVTTPYQIKNDCQKK